MGLIIPNFVIAFFYINIENGVLFRESPSTSL
jgi:hypothetical protein